jgi:hypothetical protein
MPRMTGTPLLKTSLVTSAACHDACVRDERLSVLWLCGPPGAGKSAAGRALYAGLARSGARAGFADIDQLGMCLPAPRDDPERYRLKERNLSAVTENFRAAGCDAVVVSADLGPSPGNRCRGSGPRRAALVSGPKPGHVDDRIFGLRNGYSVVFSPGGQRVPSRRSWGAACSALLFGGPGRSVLLRNGGRLQLARALAAARDDHSDAVLGTRASGPARCRERFGVRPTG